MSVPNVSETLININERDAQARIENETLLLQEANSLTNGKAGCEKTQGRVLLGLAQKMIEVSSNTREIISVLPTLQTRQECNEAQDKHIKGFNLSTNVTIITTSAMLVGLFGKFIGWW